MKKGLSPKSVNRYMAAISNVFKHALIQDDIPKMPKIYFKDVNNCLYYAEKLTDQSV